MIFDLHSHTTLSDGVLTPHELISRAIGRGVDVLAITDHDTLDAYHELPVPSGEITLIPGVEFSTQWGNTGIHIVGLNIDPQSDAISTAVEFQANARLKRAMIIGERLQSKGIQNAFEGADKLSLGSYIGRPHFAQYIVSIGRATSINAAFKKYMGDGKIGDVKQHWAELPQIIQWIRDAGGVAILAHPMKYKLTRTKLRILLADFIAAGGQGMEVISGQQQSYLTSDLAQLCDQNKLLASCGSDFHMPGRPWSELGAFPSLPANVRPVWEAF